MGFFNSILKTVKNATRKRCLIDKETNTLSLLLNTQDENYFTLEFTTMEYQSLPDSALKQSYKIDALHEKLGKLHIEIISLKHDFTWYVAAMSAFNLFIKQEFKNNPTSTQSYKNDTLSLTKYKTDNGFEFGAIYLSLVTHDLFILDQNGVLFNDLITLYEVNNEDLKITNPPKQLQKIDQSIAALNVTQQFFKKSSH